MTYEDALEAVAAELESACAHPHKLHSGEAPLDGYFPPMTARSFTFILIKSYPDKALCSSGGLCNNCSRLVKSPMDDIVTEWSGCCDKIERYTWSASGTCVVFLMGEGKLAVK